jgi:hypothetical protein
MSCGHEGVSGSERGAAGMTVAKDVAAEQPLGRGTEIDGALASDVYAVIKAWYGDLSGGAKALEVNIGTLYQYCFAKRRIPRSFLEELVSRRDRALVRRRQELLASVDRKHEQVRGKLAAIAVADAQGMTGINNRLTPDYSALVHTHTGYKPIEQAKPHPRKRTTRPLMSQ